MRKKRSDAGKERKCMQTHGLSKTRFAKIYKNMKDRCNNQNHKSYKYYGSRGIECKWNDIFDFKNNMYISYLEHVEKFGEKETTIDRIDNNGNYCKENCRWATMREQSRNIEKNVWIEHNGETNILSDWGIKLGISISTLSDRYKKGLRGNELLKVYERPNIVVNGISKSVTNWGKRLGIGKTTAYKLLKENRLCEEIKKHKLLFNL